MVAHRNYASFLASRTPLVAVPEPVSAPVAKPSKPAKASRRTAPVKLASVPQSAPVPTPLAAPAYGRNVQRAAMRVALQRCASVADLKSTMPMLAHVAIRSSDDHVVLCATDLEIALTIRVPAKGPDALGIAVPAKAALDMVKLLPDDSMSLERTEGGCKLTSGKVAMKIVGLPDRDFPKIPSFPDLETVQIEAADLKEMIDATLFSVCHDETRFHLNGAYLEGNGEMTRVVTTDGHRLTLAARRSPLKTSGVIVRAKGCREILALLADGPCEVGFSRSHMIVRQNGAELAIKLIDAQFPPYGQVIPKDNRHTVTADRKALLAAFKRGKALSCETRGCKLQRDADTGEFMISTDHPDIGTMTERVDASGAGDFTSGVNPEYAIEVLAALECDSVTMSFSGELDPMVVRPAGSTGPALDAEFLAVIMPMRV